MKLRYMYQYQKRKIEEVTKIRIMTNGEKVKEIKEQKKEDSPRSC